MMAAAKKSKIYGIGVGPGDPELVTIKAKRLIGEADLIAYPAPETGESFARSIVRSYLPQDVEEYAIRMNIGDGSYPKEEIYDKAAAFLEKEANRGRAIAILCEGDPFFYGSFLYLFQRLSSRCTVEVVPGVSSLMACAAALGQPLASRNHILTIIPAPLSEQKLRERLKNCENAAIMKLGRHLAKVRRILASLNLEDRALYIERATLPEQKIMPLHALKEEEVPYFSMILVQSGQEER